MELPGALRWVRRRVRLVHNVLVRVIGLIPDRLAGCAATMVAVRERLASDRALMGLRALASGQLRTLPSPLGFQPHGFACVLAVAIETVKAIVDAAERANALVSVAEAQKTVGHEGWSAGNACPRPRCVRKVEIPSNALALAG